MKNKLPKWARHQWRSKLVVLGMIVGGVMLCVGWLDLRAEANAMRKYEQELMQNVDCFPKRESGDRGV